MPARPADPLAPREKPAPTVSAPSAQAPGQKVSAPPAATPIGVGIDTARYGHHATFLRGDLQVAAPNLNFAESAPGYQQLRERLQRIADADADVHFHIRLDVAGAYADNLITFLHSLPWPKTISAGEAQRNKNYRTAVFGHKKSDPVESAACARYALTERPQATPEAPPPLRLLRQLASRLEAQTRQCTRLVNQLHHLLARVFPELALVANDLAAGWVLKLLDRYPTAAKLAAARPTALKNIPYLDHDNISILLAHARASSASLTGPVAEQLIKDQVRQVREAHIRQKSLEKLLVDAYHDLPEDNHVASIKGIGEVTAAVLTAKIVDSNRFATDSLLVGYFGTFPVEASSGTDREGKRRPPTRWVMCPRGSDLVRRYLYMAALSAAQHNPAVRPVYQRVRAKHPDHPAIAVGRAMNKLVRLVFAVWKSGKPFDPNHYAWERPAHVPVAETTSPPVPNSCSNEQAAGHHPETQPEEPVVTAACSASASAITSTPAARPLPLPSATTAPSCSDIPMSVSPDTAPSSSSPWLDFAHLRRQLPLQRVLEQLDRFAGLRGRGRQRRGPCPVHDSSSKGRTFSVHLGKNVFQCFDPACGVKGDLIDLWAAVNRLPLRDAALDLVRTFGLEPAPKPRTEKRHG